MFQTIVVLTYVYTVANRPQTSFPSMLYHNANGLKMSLKYVRLHAFTSFPFKKRKMPHFPPKLDFCLCRAAAIG
jgi:hypothetical protein